MKNVFRIKIDNMEKNPGNDIWYSYYGIIYDNKLVGTIGPKGQPNDYNQIEIGYGISQKYWNLGITTDAIKLFCDWYFKNTSIKSIIAETDNSNYSSQKVLEKNGFQKNK